MYSLDLPGAATGDQMIDKWEKEIRSGIVPDLTEDLPPEEAEKILRWSRKAYKNKQAKGMIPLPDDNTIGDVISEMENLIGDDDAFEEDY